MPPFVTFTLAPRGTAHRACAPTLEPLVPMFEPAATLNAANLMGDRMVADLKRL